MTIYGFNIALMTALFNIAAGLLSCRVDELTWWSWPQVFSDTSGPHGGMAGQMLTTFQVFGFESPAGERLMCCDGIWRPWNGEQRWV